MREGERDLYWRPKWETSADGGRLARGSCDWCARSVVWCELWCSQEEEGPLVCLNFVPTHSSCIHASCNMHIKGHPSRNMNIKGQAEFEAYG